MRIKARSKQRRMENKRRQKCTIQVMYHFIDDIVSFQSVNILPPSAPPHQIQLQQERQVQSLRNETQSDLDREEDSGKMDEVKNLKTEVEALKRQNQSVVNKYRQLQGAIEADI